MQHHHSYLLVLVYIQLDGKNTQGENIADNGGLKESFRVTKKLLCVTDSRCDIVQSNVKEISTI